MININLQLFADEPEHGGSQEPHSNINPSSCSDDPQGSAATEKDEVLEKDYTEKFDELNKSLKMINSNLSELANVDELPKDNSINMSSSDNKKILVDAKNEKLTDYEVYRRALIHIDEDKKNGKVVQIAPKFIEYMRQYVDNHEKGIMTDADFKKQSIFEEISLSDLNL